MTNLAFFLYAAPVAVTGLAALGALLFVRLMPRPTSGSPVRVVADTARRAALPAR